MLVFKSNSTTLLFLDGSAAGPGAPEATLTSPEGESVSVALAAAGPGLWRATYTPRRPGDHQLRVVWAGRLVKGATYVVLNVVSYNNMFYIAIYSCGCYRNLHLKHCINFIKL